ncbi:hypothetical protein [uncultured Amaricoccus sp.]|uniref:hypothetical protein n=1 Tax=uncultured Amaricoccus sp. TaxID=339341 RepID=UPI002634B063|nr:hypothetical protein [uncultured Amaricoccus sp.]
MSDAHEIIRLAIVGSGANFGSHAAATRVLAALPKLIDDAMVERAVDAWWDRFDGPGFNFNRLTASIPVRRGMRAALIAALTETPDAP